jgi:adenylate cyclase
MTATTCRVCGVEPLENARFCHSCGSPITAAAGPAEFKQVTILFADVVHSMDIAAAVGAERLREIMAQLFAQCAAVVRRYDGTVDKFTGDGIMAVFGAPIALEDHAFRACLAALEIQGAEEAGLQLRVGLNSGEVVAGEIGSGPGSYTTIGEQVGLAQRMESVAAPGGVMLSEATARLVEDHVMLGESELVQIKGAAEPVRAYRLLAVSSDRRQAGRQDPSLVGRSWELGALAGMLDQAIEGSGCVVGVIGPPGIGKSRIAREVAALAQQRGIEVFTTYCESHASEIPFYTVNSLLRTALGVSSLGDESARVRVRERVPDADPQDLLLLDDLLGIADSGVELPVIDPDARRRRLTRLVNTISLARQTPAVFVIEDTHWIDGVSESLVADFLAVIPQTPSLVLITYRPEYRGELARVSNSQTITLAALNASQTSALAGDLVGSHPSVAHLAARVAERAAGNPFFAEEMVRDLAERAVLSGERGSYICHSDPADVAVPATLQATIAARIDRLEPAAKQTLNAAAVIGLRFSAEQLALLDTHSQTGSLVAAELIDQVRFTPYAEYAFHHPLVRTVAYESQLKSSRAVLHRRLAAAIEQRHPNALDENAALIAEHLEAAGDLHATFDWHMRAGTWLTHRNMIAARASWQRARDVADRLPDSDPERTALRIAPRTLLCATSWFAGGTLADTGFGELRGLAGAADDKVSLAMGMAGWLPALIVHARFPEASLLASELTSLLESIGDPTLTLGLLYSALAAKFQRAEMTEVVQLAQRMIDLADGDATKGDLIVASPLACAIMLRGCARCCLGDRGWRDDVEQAATMLRAFEPSFRAVTLLFKYTLIGGGVWRPDAAALQETAEVLALAERSGDDLTLASARQVRGIALMEQDGPGREEGMALLAAAREAAVQERFTMIAAYSADNVFAQEHARAGDLDGAIALSRVVLEELFVSGDVLGLGQATAVLGGLLLLRGTDTDAREVQALIDRLMAVPTEPGFVVHDIWLLRVRALLARAKGDADGYRDLVAGYRKMADDLGFEGHIALAEAMT